MARRQVPVIMPVFAATVVTLGAALAGAESSLEQEQGFIAQVTGARNVTISGEGVFYCIPAYEYTPGYQRPSVLVMADAQGVRENGIAFSLIGKPFGTYELATNPNPFVMGTVFEVRVELGSTTDYFDEQTAGTITVLSMPEGTLEGRIVPLRRRET